MQLAGRVVVVTVSVELVSVTLVVVTPGKTDDVAEPQHTIDAVWRQ
jgi:hypothetical protein